MRLAKVSVVIVCAIALFAGVAQAGNLLLNGDFETGNLNNWIVAGVSPNSSAVVEANNGPSAPGTHSVYMDNHGQALALVLKQSTEVGAAIPGLTMYSFDLKLDQADVGGVVFVEIFAERSTGGIAGGSGLLGPFWPWNNWTHFAGSFNAPADTGFLTIQIEAVTGAAVGSNCKLHVDNVVLDQGTVATENTTWGNIQALYR